MELIEPSRPSDLAAVTELLDRCGLPSADVAPHLAQFIVARDDGRLVGTIGLEVFGRRGLVRSLAVAEDRRGRGLALRLYASQLAVAHRLGVTDLYCLTTTAQSFFEMLGWSVLPGDEVPDEIRDTGEFRAWSSQRATCMSRTMPQN